MTSKFSTSFDSCEFTEESNNLRCVNNYNTVFSALVHAEPIHCSTHYCTIMENQIEGMYNTLSCSGAVLSIQHSNLYNPLSPSSISLDGYNIVTDHLEFNEYYFNDVRTEFASNIASIECSDRFKTCIGLEDGSSMCFGNVSDKILVYPLVSFFASFGICLFLGICILGTWVTRDTSSTNRGRFVASCFLFIVNGTTIGIMCALMHMSTIAVVIGGALVYGGPVLYMTWTLLHSIWRGLNGYKNV